MARNGLERRENNKIFGSFVRFNTTGSLTVARVGVFTSQKITGLFSLFFSSLLGHQCCVPDSTRLGVLVNVSLNLYSAITPFLNLGNLFELRFNFSLKGIKLSYFDRELTLYKITFG